MSTLPLPNTIQPLAPDERTQIVVYMSHGERRRFRQYALDNDSSMSAIARGLILHHIGQDQAKE